MNVDMCVYMCQKETVIENMLGAIVFSNFDEMHEAYFIIVQRNGNAFISLLPIGD